MNDILKREVTAFLKLFMEANECTDAIQVNDGYCGDFAFLLNEHLKKIGLPTFELLDTDTHVWLFDGNKNYDAECLIGVDYPLDLPFFKRYYAIK